MQDIQNRVVFVTGGTKGLGAVICKKFAQAGAKVVLFGRDEVDGKRIEKELNEICEGALFIKGDVVNNADIENAMNIILEKYGTLDFAVNNAAITGELHPFLETSVEQYDQIMDINVKGVYQCMQNELKIMSKNRFGKIVNVTSEAAFNGGYAGFSAYICSKHAVNGLTKAAAVEFAEQGININAIAPGTMQTPMVESFPKEDVEKLSAIRPTKRLVEVDSVANTVLYLCSSYSKDMIGASVIMDGGYSAS